MSKLVAFAAIQGGYNIVSKTEGKLKQALETYGGAQKLEFPNTAYFLPIIYSLTGIKVETLEDAIEPLKFARKLLPPHVKSFNHLPYLGPLLDAGMAALFAEEIAEAIRYVETPDFYYVDRGVRSGKRQDSGWERPRIPSSARRGVEFVDGTAPGFAAIVGAAPNIGDGQEDRRGVPAEDRSMSSWPPTRTGPPLPSSWWRPGSRSVGTSGWFPSDRTSPAAVFALGFANRAAMAFGGD